MSVREKGPRSAWSSPTRPFSRPVRRADRAETGGLYVCSLALHCRERLAGGASWIRTLGPPWKEHFFKTGPEPGDDKLAGRLPPGFDVKRHETSLENDRRQRFCEHRPKSL